jgi:threonine aldolase
MSKKVIDLRSDTVTLPSPAMRQAMAEAELGDDVYGEDPTINHLEEMAAERLGKEAALFVASGTMGNLVALLTYCGRGDEVILGDRSHTFVNEAGGCAALGGIHPHPIPNQPDGTLDLGDIGAAIRGDNIHYPRTRLICLENTHNYCGGTVLSAEYTAQVGTLARKHGLALHMDGARVFDAAVALGVEAAELVREVDTVMFCLSKGLSAPVGSVLCGSRDFIHEARRARKIVGGGMRQAGILAAAGIVALEEMVGRLAEDHANARRLAEGLAGLEGISLNLDSVHTNMIFFDLTAGRISAWEFVERLDREGVRLLNLGPRTMRMVTHYGISAGDIDDALSVIKRVMREM